MAARQRLIPSDCQNQSKAPPTPIGSSRARNETHPPFRILNVSAITWSDYRLVSTANSRVTSRTEVDRNSPSSHSLTATSTVLTFPPLSTLSTIGPFASLASLRNSSLVLNV